MSIRAALSRMNADSMHSCMGFFYGMISLLISCRAGLYLGYAGKPVPSGLIGVIYFRSDRIE